MLLAVRVVACCGAGFHKACVASGNAGRMRERTGEDWKAEDQTVESGLRPLKGR